MPNHVTHRMTVTGPVDAIKAFYDRMLPIDAEGNQGFDFSGIIPQPEILKRTISPAHMGENGRQMLRDITAVDDPFGFKTVEATVEEQAELDALDHKDWYSWANACWGTKWGAYSFRMQQPTSPEAIEFTFDTAWSAPTPVFEKLAEEFDTLEFTVSAFDEGWNFAYRGFGADGVFSDKELEATDEEYENVYGHAPEHYDDEEEAA